MQYLSFCDSLILLRIMPLRFIHVVLQLIEVKELFPHFILGVLWFQTLSLPLINFELMFVYGLWHGCNLILLYVSVHFSQYHFLQKLCFPHFVFLTHLSKVSWLYTYGFTSEPLVCMSAVITLPFCLDYYSFVIQFKIWNCNISSFVFLSQDCFGYLRSFVVPFKF